jgi:hypothetical protein
LTFLKSRRKIEARDVMLVCGWVMIDLSLIALLILVLWIL